MTRETKAAAEAVSTLKRRWLDVADAGRERIERRTGDALKAGKRAAVAVDESFKERPIVMHVLALAAGFALAAFLFRRR